MLKTCLQITFLALASTAVMAAPRAPLETPPPYAGDVTPGNTLEVAPPKVTLPPPKHSDPLQLAPDQKDMEKARQDRAEGRVPLTHDKRTKIEEVRDQNNRVTEYVVTPATTQIPYSIENRAERPIDNTPGGNSKSTLGTPKFIEFGW